MQTGPLLASTIRRLFGPQLARNAVPVTGDEAVLDWYATNRADLDEVAEVRTAAAAEAVAVWLAGDRGPLDAFTRDHGAWLLAPLTQVLGEVCEVLRWDGTGNHIEELVGAAASFGSHRGTSAVVGRVALRRAITAAVARDPQAVFALPDAAATLAAAIDGLVRFVAVIGPQEQAWLQQHLTTLFPPPGP